MKTLKRLVSFLLVFSMIASMLLTVSAVENNTRAAERTGITIDRVTTQNKFGESVTHAEGYYWTDKKLEEIPVTYEAWVYMPSSVTYPQEGNVILSTLPQVYAAGTANFFSFELKNGSEPKLMFGYNNKNVTEVVFWNEGRVPKDQWVHLALVHDTVNQTVSCYHNGELKESKTFAFVPDSSAIESYVALAGDRATANARAFTGILGDVAVYSDVRNAADVRSDYTNGADVNDDDLLLYYQISADKQEKDLVDLSGNGYDMNYNRVFFTEAEMEEIRAKDDKEYAYSIAFIPDIQILTEYFPEKLPPVFDYVLDNIDDKNIKYMVTLGDLTDTNTQEEWDLVKAQLDRFNGILPYSIFRGNHDGVWAGQAPIYDTIFADPDSDYYKHVQANGGFYDTSSVKNTYLLFEESGTRYMLLNLDYGITDEKVLDWADEVIEAHPDRRVIIATHAWLGSHGEPFATGEWSSPGTEVSGSIDPDRMWEEHFRKHANIDMIICGHSHSDQILCTPVVGDNGNVVYQVLMDSQFGDLAVNGAGKGLGGIGVVGIMYFTEDGRFAKIEYYSTVFERYYYEGHTDISLDFDAEEITYSVATDVDGKLLNVKDVNDTVWVEDEDGLYLSGDYTSGLLVFDDKLNANRIEFTIVDKFMNDGDANHRNGIVFALTDEEGDGSFGYNGKDISYYWLFLQGDTNTLRILEMGKYNPDWTRFTGVPDFSLADNGIDAKNGVRIEVEWDEQGNIKVWADGKVAFDFKDETPLTGDLYGLMVNDWSNKVSNGHSDSVDANFTSFIAGKVIYDNCIDVDGNPLNVKVVNGVTWVEKNGMVEMPAGPSNSFLLFDSKLNANRIEATIVIRDNLGWDTNSHRNGLVFALTDHDGDLTFNYDGTDVSYYWAFVTDDDKVEVRKMGKYNGWSVIGPASATLTSLGIDVTKGVALAAEWDDQGHIKVYANGILVQDITDTRGDPLTGKYYGMLVYKYGNSQGPDYAFPYDAPVMSFVAGKTPIGDICTDADENALNPVFVNGIEWTVVDGKLKMPKGHENSFLLFDKELTVNRIEATLVINDNINNDTNHRNGIVFALTDHESDLSFAYAGTDVSYYWAFVNDYGCVEVRKMGKYQGWTTIGPASANLKTLGIDVTKGVTLAAEWDDEGHIKVYADGQLVQDITDSTDPLNGKYYGLLVNKWGNTQGPDYAYPYNAYTTSFVAGDELEAPKQVVVTVDPTGAGTVTGAGSYYLGQNVTLTATPDAGYKFAGWYENGELVSAEATISFAAADRALTAKFTSVNDYQQIVLDSVEIVAGEEAVIKLVIKNNPGITGLVVTLNYDKNVLTLVGAENGTLFSGFESALNITWDEIFDVTEDGTLATLTFAVAEGAQAGDYTVEVVVRDCINSASEDIDIMTVNGTITVLDDPDPITVTASAAEGGTVSGAGSYEQGTSVTVTATANTGYKFVGWYKGTTKVSANAAYTFNATENVTLTAKFEKIVYTVGATAGEGGTVSGAGSYEHGASVTLTATAAEGYKFIGWYNGETKVSDNAAYTFTAEAAITLTAKFEKLQSAIEVTVTDTDINYTVNGNVVTVDYALACKVGYLDGGKYVAIAATANGDGTYSFTAPEGVSSVVVVVSGDVNGDGTVNAGDYGRLNALLQGKITLTAEQDFAANTNGDATVNAGDYGRLNAVLQGKTDLTW